MIKLGKIEVPAREIAAQGNAILGIRESGKSYTATCIAEQFMEAGIPFVAFDPIGIWKNLKIPGPDRGGKGYPVVVAGENGDLPLTPASAPEIVKAAMVHNISLVIDLYSMGLSKADWRNIVENCVRVLLYGNKAHGLRHVFIEEASEFCPQRIDPGHGRVYAEIEKLGRMGGNASLGMTLINQRSEEVNKAVLELCDLLVLHRQRGRNSLTSLEKWLRFSSGDSKDIAQQIPRLGPGECFIWRGEDSPPMRTQIQRKRSYHPDRRNPDVSKEAKASQVDAGEFVRMISEALQEKDTPAEAAKIKLIDAITGAGTKEETRDRNKMVNYYEERIRDLLKGQDQANATIDSLQKRHREEIEDIQRRLKAVMDSLQAFQDARRGTIPPTKEGASGAGRVYYHFKGDSSYPNPEPEAQLGRCERQVLNAAVQRGKLSSKSQLAILSQYSVNSSTFQNAISALRQAGLLQGYGDGLSPTPSGILRCKDVQPLPTGRKLVEHWTEKLGKAEATILQVVVSHPHGIIKTDIANASGYSIDSSTFQNALSVLRTLELISRGTRGEPIKPARELLDV